MRRFVVLFAMVVVCLFMVGVLPAEVGTRSLFHIDPEWHIVLDDSEYSSGSVVDVDEDGYLYFIERSERELYKIDQADGSIFWNRSVKGTYDMVPYSLKVDGELVYVIGSSVDYEIVFEVFQGSTGENLETKTYSSSDGYYYGGVHGLTIDGPDIFISGTGSHHNSSYVSLQKLGRSNRNLTWTNTWKSQLTPRIYGDPVVNETRIFVVGSVLDVEEEKKDGLIVSFNRKDGTDTEYATWEEGVSFKYVSIATDGQFLYAVGEVVQINKKYNELISTMVLHKYDTNLEIIWQVEWFGRKTGEPSTVKITDEGHILISGKTIGFGGGHDDLVLLLFDKEGSELISFEWSEGDDEIPLDAVVQGDFCYVVGEKIDSGIDETSAFLAKFNITYGGFPKEYYKVHGRVRDSQSLKGIEGAKVKFDHKSVVTDEDGYYSINLTAGHYDVEISADGYDTYTGQARVDFEDKELNFELSEDWFDPICCWSAAILITVLLFFLLGLAIITRRGKRKIRLDEK
jgi:hypothetical protein